MRGRTYPCPGAAGRIAATYASAMLRAATAVLAAATAVLAIAVVFLFQEQREQGQELARLTECVSTLERNQGSPQRTPEGDVLIMGCPIY